LKDDPRLVRPQAIKKIYDRIFFPETDCLCSQHGGHAAAEDAYLWYMDGRWRQLWHQKIDDEKDSTGDHDLCKYFPYIGGYAVASTPGYDGAT